MRKGEVDECKLDMDSCLGTLDYGRTLNTIWLLMLMSAPFKLSSSTIACSAGYPDLCPQIADGHPDLCGTVAGMAWQAVCLQQGPLDVGYTHRDGITGLGGIQQVAL